MSGVSVAQPDITLHLDAEGVIRQAALSAKIPGEEVDGWLGRSWLETMDVPGADKARRLISDARAAGVSSFRHVVQRFPSGRELAIEYSAFRVSGSVGEVMVLGRNLQAVAELQSRVLAAQQAAEGERWKLRDIETRHRLLFDASTEAMLAVRGADLCVTEANPAAIRALRLVAGSVFSAALDPAERGLFSALLLRVREAGGAPGIVLHFGADRVAWAIRASLIEDAEGPHYLLHVTSVGVPAAPRPGRSLPLDELMERLPDGFVIADRDGRVLRANRAFLDLVQVGAAGAAHGEALGRWMTQLGADAGVLLSVIRSHGSVRSFQTVLQGELGAEIAVEVSGAGYAAPGAESFGIALREVGRRGGYSSDRMGERPRLVAALAPLQPALAAKQLGVAPLSQVVRVAVDAIERSMIAAALVRVDGNRTAAAELLGLSRQSLHTKLNRQAAENEAIGESHLDFP